MAMIKLSAGQKRQKETLTLLQWLQRHENDDTIYREYEVVSIIPPRSGMKEALLIFETANERVKVRLTEEEWSEFKDAMVITKADDLRDRVVYIVVSKDDGIGVDIRDFVDDFREAVYEFVRKSSYWRLVYLDKSAIIL